jgi:hypothetical protein
VKRVGSTYANEKAQGQFCLVKMRVKNVGKEPIHFSDENQALVDTKGREYSPDDEAWIYMDDADIYAEINPGFEVRPRSRSIALKGRPSWMAARSFCRASTGSRACALARLRTRAFSLWARLQTAQLQPSFQRAVVPCAA